MNYTNLNQSNPNCSNQVYPSRITTFKLGIKRQKQMI